MLRVDGRTHGRSGRVDRPFVEHRGHFAIHGPGVAASRGGVVEKVEGQHFAFPHGVLRKDLVDDPTAVQSGQAAVQPLDGALEIVD